jgi:alkylhydroperoxidase/carboxymuconolactone decarboxylase family protein YurZ
MSEDTDTPVLDLLARLNADAIETSTLDPEKLMLVRIAALVAMDAPPASYLLNLGAAAEVEVDAEEIQGVLAAIAPIVGTPRVVGAAGNIARALGIAIDLAELESETAQR